MAGNYGNPYKQIRVRRGLQANLPILDDGEIGFATDTGNFYVGFDGVNNLINVSGGSGGGPGASFWKPNPIGGIGGTANIIDPAVGIAALTSDNWQWIFVVGQTSAGGVHCTATPSVPAGTTVGQMLKITGTSATDYPIFQDESVLSGSGLDLNGPFNAKAEQTLVLSWNGVNWEEESRK